jgi:hypothetical protein
MSAPYNMKGRMMMKTANWRRTRITQVIIVSIPLFFHASVWAENTLSAKEIMEKASTARKLDGSESVMTLTIYNKEGEKRVRQVAMVSKIFDGGATEKRVYRFLSPPDVKGTGVLAFDYENKDDDMWIFLPALRKTRRIVSSEKSKSFIGSEFSYVDMNTPVLDNYKLKILKEEKVNGKDCFVVETLPKNDDIADYEGYSKKIIWVSKDEFMVQKAVYYDLDGQLLKELVSKDIKLIDDKKKRYRSMHMEMTNKQNGRRSVFQTDKIEFTPNTKDSYFTTEYLERP